MVFIFSNIWDESKGTFCCNGSHILIAIMEEIIDMLVVAKNFRVLLSTTSVNYIVLHFAPEVKNLKKVDC